MSSSKDLKPVISFRAWIKWGLAAAIALLAILGILIWISTGIDRVSQSITGAPNSISTSMEPYEITFKSRLKGGGRVPDDKSPYVWKMVLPRAYVVNEIGPRNAVRDNESNGGRTYYASIHSVYDEATFELTPATLASEVELKQRFVGIHAGNRGTYPEATNSTDCLIADDLFKFIESRGGVKAPANKICSKNDARCVIYTHYHGWGISLHLTRTSPLYNEPRKACEIMRTFLDKYTTHVDSVVP